ncbi:MAG: hypothetical protein HRT90_04350, partial [Candidatus Margulisbacteria bacterium]|nr:hypothetical protein [Candidatus Margulisiibacteriota bacterium]
THIIDLLLFLLGPVQKVSAVFNHHFQWPKGDCLIDGHLQFDSCNVALHFVNSQNYALGEVSLYGENGRLNLKNMWGQYIELIGTMSSPDYSAYRELNYQKPRVFGKSRSFLKGTYDYFISCYENPSSSNQHGESALDSLRIIKTLEKSAKKNGQLLDVPINNPVAVIS